MDRAQTISTEKFLFELPESSAPQGIPNNASQQERELLRDLGEQLQSLSQEVKSLREQQTTLLTMNQITLHLLGGSKLDILPNGIFVTSQEQEKNKIGTMFYGACPIQSKATGTWANGKLLDGEVENMRFYNGVYTGHVHHDLRNGHGRFVYNEGGEYNGEWLNDQPHGNGTITRGDASYVGDFENGRLNGRANITYTTRERFRRLEGVFKDGRLIGNATWKESNWVFSGPSDPDGFPHGKITCEFIHSHFNMPQHPKGGHHFFIRESQFHIGEWDHGQPKNQGTYVWIIRDRQNAQALTIRDIGEWKTHGNDIPSHWIIKEKGGTYEVACLTMERRSTF